MLVNVEQPAVRERESAVALQIQAVSAWQILSYHCDVIESDLGSSTAVHSYFHHRYNRLVFKYKRASTFLPNTCVYSFCLSIHSF